VRPEKLRRDTWRILESTCTAAAQVFFCARALVPLPPAKAATFCLHQLLLFPVNRHGEGFFSPEKIRSLF